MLHSVVSWLGTLFPISRILWLESWGKCETPQHMRHLEERSLDSPVRVHLLAWEKALRWMCAAGNSELTECSQNPRGFHLKHQYKNNMMSKTKISWFELPRGQPSSVRPLQEWLLLFVASCRTASWGESEHHGQVLVLKHSSLIASNNLVLEASGKVSKFLRR